MMKRINPAYIAKWYGSSLLILLGLFALGIAFQQWFLCLGAIIFFIIALIFIPGKLEKEMMKNAERLEQSFEKQGFTYQTRFTSNSGVFYIDLSGRLGVIWKYNPTQLCFADLSRVVNIRTHDGRILKGTSLVSCQFQIEGKQFKIYTLRVSNGSYAMTHPSVLEAISKADKLCEMLQTAKQNAQKRGTAIPG